MKRNGFTLIELLVVVAIIGILAAVGVVAYSGYTNSAKASSTKSNHSLASKYISAELIKCELGEDKVLVADPTNRSQPSFLTCSGYTNTKAQTAALQALDHIKNPYETSKVATRSGDAIKDSDVGYLNITTAEVSGKKFVVISSCFKTSCSDSKNRLENRIPTER